MLVTALIPILVMLAGAILWAAAKNPKLSEAGRLAFFAGLFASCLAFAGTSVHIGAG